MKPQSEGAHVTKRILVENLLLLAYHRTSLQVVFVPYAE